MNFILTKLTADIKLQSILAFSHVDGKYSAQKTGSQTSQYVKRRQRIEYKRPVDERKYQIRRKRKEQTYHTSLKKSLFARFDSYQSAEKYTEYL